MISSTVRVKTEKFRAIGSANIIIDGITVVAGENGCGKSTLSKLLYYTYKAISNYDLLVKNNLFSSLQNILNFVEIFQQELVFSLKDRSIKNEFRREIYELRKSLYSSNFLEDEINSWITLIDKIEYLYSNYSDNNLNLFNEKTTNNNNRRLLQRLERILKEILDEDYQNNDIRESFSKIKEALQDKFKEAAGKISNRPNSLFVEELKRVFMDSKLPKKYEVYEYEDLIASLNKSNLSISFSIQNAIYIDTPIMISVEDHNEYWDDLNNLLLDDTINHNNEISDIISSQIIKGDVENEDGIYIATDELKFKRQDGKTFNLLDVATGIKSFSILQLLLKNGKFDDKTLLIIDEPESNLHPQWIIEYARIIVLLNKKLGVKFFLASHNPDMVSAIRYLSEKEEVLDSVNFYLAEKVEGSFEYNYTFLGKNIDPIFESFNIAIDRINQYGI